MIINHMSKDTGIDSHFLASIARSSNHRYKTYRIRKRLGGFRIIHHPSRELKFLQRWLVENIFVYLPVHDKVFSYKKRVNIKTHANLHRKTNYLMRIDFKDFFPSINRIDIKSLLDKNKHLLPMRITGNDIDIISNIVCKSDKLTIGAPSSPILSNAVMYDFDCFWDRKAEENKVIYSRYADDIYFSTNKKDILSQFLKEMSLYTRENTSPKLTVNSKKTIFTSRKHKRIVTGLTLTSDRMISIGRKKKKEIKSLIHKFQLKELRREKISYLRGLLSYTRSVDARFIRSVEKKYGKKTIRSIDSMPYISLK